MFHLCVSWQKLFLENLGLGSIYVREVATFGVSHHIFEMLKRQVISKIFVSKWGGGGGGGSILNDKLHHNAK